MRGIGPNGGGIDVSDVDSTEDIATTISHCIISACVSGYGGGIFAGVKSNGFNQTQGCIIKDDVITGCLALYGGGIYELNASDVSFNNPIVDCEVIGCKAGLSGGGLFGDGISVMGNDQAVNLTGKISYLPGMGQPENPKQSYEFIGMNLIKNFTYNNGGGATFCNSSMVYGKITVEGNIAQNGGGIMLTNSTMQNYIPYANKYVDDKGKTYVCDINNNTAYFAGGGVYQINGSLYGCKILNNTVVYKYYDGGYLGGNSGVVFFGGGLYYTHDSAELAVNDYGDKNCLIQNNKVKYHNSIVGMQNIYVGYLNDESPEKSDSYIGQHTWYNAQQGAKSDHSGLRPIPFMKTNDNKGQKWDSLGLTIATVLVAVAGVFHDTIGDLINYGTQKIMKNEIENVGNAIEEEEQDDGQLEENIKNNVGDPAVEEEIIKTPTVQARDRFSVMTAKRFTEIDENEYEDKLNEKGQKTKYIKNPNDKNLNKFTSEDFDQYKIDQKDEVTYFLEQGNDPENVFEEASEEYVDLYEKGILSKGQAKLCIFEAKAKCVDAINSEGLEATDNNLHVQGGP
jgi:hypothetical protein